MKHITVLTWVWVCFCVFTQSVHAKVSVVVNQYQVPVLVGKDHNPLLHLKVVVTKGEYPTMNQLLFTAKGTTRVEDIDSIAIFTTASKAAFATNQEVGKADNPSGTYQVNTALRLEPGDNHIWVSGRLKDSADIKGMIDLQCTEIIIDGSKVSGVKDESRTIIQRIGVAVRKTGDDGVHTYRIPGATRTKAGTLLTIYDARRKSSRDLQGDMDIGLSRSVDGGKTWEPMRIIIDMKEHGGLPQELNGCSDACILVDETTGEIYVFTAWMHGVFEKLRGKSSWIHQWHRDCPGKGFGLLETTQMLMVKSSDDGKTWSKPVNITKQVKREEWMLFCPGPGNGITMKNGTIVIPAQGRDEKNVPFSCIMYSEDHGKTWVVSEPAIQPEKGTTESAVVQIDDKTLMLNMRDNRNGNNGPGRTVAITRDMGKTWTEHATSNNRTLISPRCMASLRRVEYHAKPIILFSNPATLRGRNHMTLKWSNDLGESWPKGNQILLDEWNSFGYSCITPVDDEYIGVFYEGSQAHMTFQLIPKKAFIE